MNEKIWLLEGVLMTVLNRALNADGLPAAAVRLALADALHTVQELERRLGTAPAAEAASQKATPKEGTDDGKPAKAE